MDWAIELSQREHGIENLHLKSGVCLADGSIVVLATGYKDGMPAQMGGLLLNFLVQQAGAKRKLMLRSTQFFFPSIVPRLLDQVKAVGSNKIVVVQDTVDQGQQDSKLSFEAYTIDLTRKKSGTVFQKHTRHGWKQSV